MLDKPREFARKLDTRINQRLDAVAALPPPPVFLSVQKALAVSVPMQSSVLTSIVFHLLLILGVGAQLFDPRQFAPPHNVMDVVLVNAKSATKPVTADALAQANLDGGGIPTRSAGQRLPCRPSNNRLRKMPGRRRSASSSSSRK